jgi:DMSO/TMAO reductase YedYZ molybdopterin-dependent catalytic subunit
MRAYDCKVLLCATALIVVSSAADARYWRHYGYHWYGRSWNGFRPNGGERQVERQLPRVA